MSDNNDENKKLKDNLKVIGWLVIGGFILFVLWALATALPPAMP